MRLSSGTQTEPFCLALTLGICFALVTICYTEVHVDLYKHCTQLHTVATCLLLCVSTLMCLRCV